MHGLINKSFQCFVTDTYGHPLWREVAQKAAPGLEQFEALVIYPDDVTSRVIDTACQLLDKPAAEVLEDLGNYLVTHENLEPVRRLLRFGGTSFVEFLYSLDDLHDRARLAVPDLQLPKLALSDLSGGVFELECSYSVPGFGHVLLGVLRTMADDYGDLVYLEHLGSEESLEKVRITLLETQFAEGRAFELAVSRV
ncbi:MAG: heme NO-binding domain-containing protein [Pseudomonadota bacterium]